MNAAAGPLDGETGDVPGDEEFGDPSHADGGEAFGVGGAHETAERHVDGCSEESGSDEDQEGLDDVGIEALGVGMAYCAADVAYGFN